MNYDGDVSRKIRFLEKGLINLTANSNVDTKVLSATINVGTFYQYSNIDKITI